MAADGRPERAVKYEALPVTKTTMPASKMVFVRSKFIEDDGLPSYSYGQVQGLIKSVLLLSTLLSSSFHLAGPWSQARLQSTNPHFAALSQARGSAAPISALPSRATFGTRETARKSRHAQPYQPTEHANHHVRRCVQVQYIIVCLQRAEGIHHCTRRTCFSHRG